MRPENLTIELRPRQPWEAADLGCALVRRDYGAVLAAWCATVLPLWLLVALLMRNHPAYFSLVVWWLKPLYDRVPLHLLSRSAFGVKTRLAQTLKSLPGLWGRFLLPALLWRRLSPARSFAMPVWMLEGQRGKKLRSRLKALDAEGGGSGATLTWVFIKLEIAVFLGLLALTSFAAPSSGFEDYEEFFAAAESGSMVFPDAWYWWWNICYLLAVLIVEPFYAGAGFGMYLNSRSKLEGWDIDLAFRKTAARLLKAAAPVTALFLLLATASPLTAQEDKPGATLPADGNELAKNILAEPDFEVHSQTRRVWMPDTQEGADFSLLYHIFVIVGYAVLAAVVVFLVVLLIRAATRLKAPVLMRPARINEAAPVMVMGMSITRESLPADLLAAARAAWAQGAQREALSLLYRGALSALVEQRQLGIRASDTEDDCLQRVEQSEAPPVAGYFQRLTWQWMRAAYAGQSPAAPEFESLCRDWPFAALEARASGRGGVFAAALIVIASLGLVSCRGHWENVTRETGYKGPARIDPFLAAQRFLEERGHTTRRAPNLKDLPPAWSGLVLASAESGMPMGRARPLLSWVRDGGHLIYVMAGGGPYNDWNESGMLLRGGAAGDPKRPDPVLAELNVECSNRLHDLLSRHAEEEEKDEEEKDESFPLNENRVVSRLRHGGDTLNVELPDHITFAIERSLRAGEFQSAKDEAIHLLSLRHGHGRVTLLNHARPLRNRYLAEHDHGRLLDLLAGEEPLEALFVVGLEGSFWQLLWERGWRLLLALPVLLALWLWAVIPRFGPVREAVLHPVRRFADHLDKLGHFYFKLRRQSHLLASAQSALRRKLRETHPHLTAEAAQLTLLSERSGLPDARVRAALADPAAQPASQLVRLLQDLQTLKHSLS